MAKRSIDNSKHEIAEKDTAIIELREQVQSVCIEAYTHTNVGINMEVL